MTSRAALRAALTDRLGSANEARWMVEEVLGARVEAEEETVRALGDLAARRLEGEPLQYVLGSWAFRTLELSVDHRALIPRPETEQVVEVALAELCREDQAPREPSPELWVADLGTGSGAIALSLAAELGTRLPGLHVAGTDVDPGALALAEENRRRVASRLPHVAAQVELRAGSWYGALAPEWRGRVHLVVANPPYVSEDEWPGLEPEVRREPRGALVAGPGSDGTPGLGAVEVVLAGAREWLVPGRAAVVEMAPHQVRPARELSMRAGYREVRVARDLSGRERAVVARA
ncbi:MAG: HemK/PrmC family methyltransferase [Acidimicrobiales bacterium]